MSSELAVRARGLGKAYGHAAGTRGLWSRERRRPPPPNDPAWALQPLDLDVRRGESLAVIGRNGSGKSTLLQLICGTLSPTVGEVRVRGRIAPMLELGAGFHPMFTGRENVRLSATVLGLSARELRARESSIWEFADLGDKLDQPVAHYSSGMYARLAFAVAAFVDADLLVVDEILAVGDAGFAQKCMRFIRGFRERGTLLFVSHDSTAVLSLCERALWLDAGVVRGIGPAREVCRDYEASLQVRESERGALRIGGIARSELSEPVRDPRAALLEESRHRNELELFHFDPDAPQFGYGRARIESVELLDAQGRGAALLRGGEVVRLAVTARATEAIESAIVGFVVKNRVGQALFSDNTWLSTRDTKVALAAGQVIRAVFTFQLPFLPSGDFAIDAAVADGSQAEHSQQHWLHEALLFKVHSSHVARGLVGVPMLGVEIEREDAHAGPSQP
jgi:lipopolysaccharide transport system ATP-binding protein